MAQPLPPEPPKHVEPREQCPLAIEPGVALGPVRIGDSRDVLERAGWPLKNATESGDTVSGDVGPLRVQLCGGDVYEVWLEDLREAPPCVTAHGKPVPADMKREDVIALFDRCEEAAPRIGGSFTECADGAVRFGYGMGDFLQIRVAKAGFSIDDDCSHVLDPGTAVKVDPDTLAPLVERVVDLPELSPYWHPETPGRKPVRIAPRSALADVEPWNKLGQPVEFVDAEEARAKGQPVFELTRIHGTATRIELAFEYAVEGIAGVAAFKKHGDTWQLVDHDVAER